MQYSSYFLQFKFERDGPNSAIEPMTTNMGLVLSMNPTINQIYCKVTATKSIENLMIERNMHLQI
jgi:hypothetical protein